MGLKTFRLASTLGTPSCPIPDSRLFSLFFPTVKELDGRRVLWWPAAWEKKKCQNRNSLVEEVLLGQLTHLVTFSDIFILHDSLLQGDMCIFIHISC